MPRPSLAQSPGFRLISRRKALWPVLADGDVCWFLGGQLLSTAGSWMTRVAIGWLIFRLTGSALWLGVAGFAGQMPVLLLAPLSGAIIDRFDRRRILAVTYGLASAQAVGLAALSWTGYLDIATLLGMAVVRGGVAAFELPARQAFLCRTAVDGEACLPALAADSLVVNIGRLLGPSLAGLFIALGGEALCFLLDGLSYAAPLLALVFRPGRLVRRETGPRNGLRLSEGWAWIRQRSDARKAFLRLCLLSLTGLPFTVLLPAYVHGVLTAGAEMLGWMISMSSLGAIAASCLVGREIREGAPGRQWPLCLGASACLMLLGVSRWWELSLFGVFGASFCLMWQIVTASAALHLQIPEAMRGRLAACCAVAFWGMVPFGGLMLGAAARFLPVSSVLCLSGLICLVVAFLPEGEARRIVFFRRRAGFSDMDAF
ncbi:MFS transporter [Telmatospirillum siberiense]|uniref:MFS transporter n=1 Tax=Telmatospirillum siberiense TaxID=382514 RepID=A0A2N3PQ96_9PROT|nr:MFS transporter [Telmatospirillum siberiense]PKU22558.1 hypothetical protein CWS72_21130 [Telmatospirillum siberiense]